MKLFDKIVSSFEGVRWLEKTRKMKTFTSLEDIGVTTGNETIETIVNNLPAFSTLIFTKYSGTGNEAIYPLSSGIVTVTKTTGNGRVSFKCENEYHLFKSFYNDYYDEAFSGWMPVNKGAYNDFSDDLNTVLIPFVYATVSASNLPTENSYYVQTLYSQKHKNTHRKQIAYHATDIVKYERQMINGVWTEWIVQ